MQPIESEGATVAEAVDAALRLSGLRRDQVEIDVLQEASSGFLTLGAKSARVRLTEKRWGPDAPAPSPAEKPALRPVRARAEAPRARPSSPSRPQVPAPAPRPTAERRSAAAIPSAEPRIACDRAKELVLALLRLMGIAAPTAAASWDEPLQRVKIAIESQDASLLIQHDGRALEALQFLATLILSREAAVPTAVQVDALSHWEKRERSVLDAARLAIESVKATGRPVRLEPMDASMRRLIHRTYAASPDVTTASEGEGSWRKIVIRSKKA